MRAEGEKKRRWALMPWQVLGLVVDAFAYGADKHSDNGWIYVDDAGTEYAGASQRHLEAIWKGEFRDKESGMFHAAHLAADALIMLWHHNNGNDDNGEINP